MGYMKNRPQKYSAIFSSVFFSRQNLIPWFGKKQSYMWSSLFSSLFFGGKRVQTLFLALSNTTMFVVNRIGCPRFAICELRICELRVVFFFSANNSQNRKIAKSQIRNCEPTRKFRKNLHPVGLVQNLS